MNKKIGLFAVIMLVLAFNITPVLARPCMPAVEVTKETTCERGPGYTTNPCYFELDGEKIYPKDEDAWNDQESGAIPVYPMGQKLVFWIKITVKANTELDNVVVYDRLGGELMIDGVDHDSGEGGDIPDYAFTYHDYERDGIVQIAGVPAGYLNKDGVVCKDPENGDLKVYWTGNSVKAHIQWDIGHMDEGEVRRIWLVVSTDTNPAGKQEYTSPGTYMLNSGATVKALLVSTGKQVSNRSEQIIIKVVDECCCCD